MLNKETALCFTGHRTEKLPQTEEELKVLKMALYIAIDEAVKSGIDTFITGVCYGFDLMAAEQILFRRRVIKPGDPEEIKVAAVIPFEGQANRWNEETRDTYFDILSKCDEVITLNAQYKNGCYHERNRFMVDNSSRIIAYYDGSGSGTGYTIDYAKKAGLAIVNLYEKAD